MREVYVKILGLLDGMDVMIKAVARQDYMTVINHINWLSATLSQVLSEVLVNKEYFARSGLDINEEYVMGMLSSLMDCLDDEDYVLYCDLLRLQVTPLLIDFQNGIRFVDGEDVLLEKGVDLFARNLEKLKKRDPVLYEALCDAECLWKESDYYGAKYQVEPTTVGAWTMSVVRGGKTYYLSSNYNPYEEARFFADYYYDVEKEDYLIYGLAFGYHAEALMKKDRNARITIFESDIAVIQKLFETRMVDWYWNCPNMRIVYDKDYSAFGAAMAQMEESVLIIYRPSLMHVANSKVKQKMEDYVIRDNSVRVYDEIFVQNSRVNFRCCDGYVDELREEFEGKQVIIVAAGPSLGKNIHLLKKKPENTIIFAVGAVFRKLVEQGIDVDYVIITDPKQVTVSQIRGLEDQKVPMLLLSTAILDIAKLYQGKKYLICQKGYDRAEQYAKEHNYYLYHTGGSVATTALDIAIQFKASRIVFVGLDLAFTGNQMHVSGGGEQGGFAGLESMIEVPAIGSGVVYTSRSFDSYRRWMERRVKEADVTMPVHDATEGGAVKQGMIVSRLEELISLGGQPKS